MFKLYLDPGHGGSDPGAVGNGIKEKDITLMICQRIKERLLSQYSGINIRMSRTGDTYPTLPARTNDANHWGADFFLSVHINSGGATGFESFIFPGSGKPSTTWQNEIHREIVKTTGFDDRGKKQKDLHVLRESLMPALLTENGFIDYPDDAAKLKNKQFIEKIALGHVTGITQIAQLQPLPPKDTEMYRLITGTFPSISEQEAAEEKLKNNFGWVVYTVNSNGLRLITGTFNGKDAAEKAAEQVRRRFGWVVYVKKDEKSWLN